MRRLLVAAAVAAAGCGAGSVPSSPEDPGPVVLATFTGEMDTAAGTFVIQAEPAAPGLAMGMSALVIPSGTPGVTVANAPNSLWNNAQNGCGTTATSGAIVRVTSNYSAPTVLANLYAEITSLTPSTAAACNSAAAIPGVTAANGGLWSYGDVAAGAAVDRSWAFTFATGTRSSFKGRIVAFRVDAWTARMPQVAASPFRVMAGSATSAVFLDPSSRTVQFVNAAGAVVQSAALTFAPASIATTADGSQVWVQGTSRIARLDAAGAIVGEYDVSAVGAGAPGGIAVDPISGVVWFGVTGATDKVGWFDPASQNVGSLTFGANGGGSGLVAVAVGGTCYLYTGTDSTSSLARVNCSAKTVDPSIALAWDCLHDGAWPMVAGAGGEVFMGAGGSLGGFIPYRTVCRVSGTAVSRALIELSTATYTGLAYGADGNLWAMQDTNGLSRIWLGAPGTYTKTAVAVPPTGNAIVAGAGAAWIPKNSATAGKSDLTRVVP